MEAYSIGRQSDCWIPPIGAKYEGAMVEVKQNGEFSYGPVNFVVTGTLDVGEGRRRAVLTMNVNIHDAATQEILSVQFDDVPMYLSTHDFADQMMRSYGPDLKCVEIGGWVGNDSFHWAYGARRIEE